MLELPESYRPKPSLPHSKEFQDLEMVYCRTFCGMQVLIRGLICRMRQKRILRHCIHLLKKYLEKWLNVEGVIRKKIYLDKRVDILHSLARIL